MSRHQCSDGGYVYLLMYWSQLLDPSWSKEGVGLIYVSLEM